MKKKPMSSRARTAQKVTWVGFFVNLLLAVGKLFSGIVGHSSAMVADAVHSFSDFATDIIVLAFVRVSDKGSDTDHHYGHGKFETFATLLISFALLLVGVGICWSGLQSIVKSGAGEALQRPSILALLAALISILAKEWLFQYTVRVGKSINNQAVIANAWHHRSDAFSSIATLLGIGGAIFLGSKWRILDPLASMLVSFFIMRVAVKLAMPSVNELLEAALPDTIQKEIAAILQQTPDVKSFHKLKTRKIGAIYAIDVHVQLDPDISLVQSHDIASEIEGKLRDRYGPDTQISIHTEPLRTHSQKDA